MFFFWVKWCFGPSTKLWASCKTWDMHMLVYVCIYIYRWMDRSIQTDNIPYIIYIYICIYISKWHKPQKSEPSALKFRVYKGFGSQSL